MASATNRLIAFDDDVCVFIGGFGRCFHNSELIELMKTSRSLVNVRQKFPGSRRNVIETLSHFGYDFDLLLREQFAEGLRDTELAALHGVDAKWCARKRKEFGIPPHRGRPKKKIPDEVLREAYQHSAGSRSGAARFIGVSRHTLPPLSKISFCEDDS